MPAYPYECEPCRRRWEVVKSMSMIDDPEPCPGCASPGMRRIGTGIGTSGAGDWNTQTWNPALGCYTRSNAHARQIAKRNGLEEIGTEPVEKLHAHFEKKRQEIREDRWREADREKQYGD